MVERQMLAADEHENGEVGVFGRNDERELTKGGCTGTAARNLGGRNTTV